MREECTVNVYLSIYFAPIINGENASFSSFPSAFSSFDGQHIWKRRKKKGKNFCYWSWKCFLSESILYQFSVLFVCFGRETWRECARYYSLSLLFDAYLLPTMIAWLNFVSDKNLTYVISKRLRRRRIRVFRRWRWSIKASVSISNATTSLDSKSAYSILCLTHISFIINSIVFILADSTLFCWYRDIFCMKVLFNLNLTLHNNPTTSFSQ